MRVCPTITNDEINKSGTRFGNSNPKVDDRDSAADLGRLSFGRADQSYDENTTFVH